MSQIKTLNGVQYTLPSYNDTSWGANTGNVLTQYLAAIADVTLQLTGGAFTLTADADFGANFGLKALYLKSETANPASAGVLRLAKTDSIGWRNNANGADKLLTIDGSDNLTYASNKVYTAGGAAGIVNADIAVGAAIAYSKLALTASIVNADIGASAAIAYSKLALSGSIVNADIAVGAAIAYSKLALTGSLVNGDLTAGTILNSAINASAAIAHSKMAALSFSVVPVTDGSGIITSSTTTATELGYLHNVTSAIQTQINAKVSAASPTLTGTVTIPDGVNATDAASFGQIGGTGGKNAAGYIKGTVVATVQVLDATSVTSSGTTFTATNTAASITPKATTHKIKITVSGTLKNTSASSTNFVTIYKASSDISPGSGFIATSALVTIVPAAITYLDSPATTSSTTYTVRISSTISGAANWNPNGASAVILLEEIAF